MLSNIIKNGGLGFRRKKVTFNGVPSILIKDGFLIELGSGCTLNSQNIGYHLNMHSCVKLIADCKGAKIKIGSQTRIHGSCVHARNYIEIGKRCLIAANCQIIDSNGHEAKITNPEKRILSKGVSKPIIIEDDVWLGAGVKVLAGAHIGRGSVVGTVTVVTGFIPPMSIVVGQTCKVVAKVNDNL